MRLDFDDPKPSATITREHQLVADVEGLALAPEGGHGGHLVASSQGDNAYVLYDLIIGTYVNRFRLVNGAKENRTRNFKLVSWQKIAKATEN